MQNRIRFVSSGESSSLSEADIDNCFLIAQLAELLIISVDLSVSASTKQGECRSKRKYQS